MEDKNLNVLDHLDELRKRLIYSAIAFFVFFGLSFFFILDIYDFLTKDIYPDELQILAPSDTIWVYFMIASVVALAALIPFVAFQLWLFVRPALKRHEVKAALGYIPALFVLFAGGIIFGYFIIYPIILDFLMSLGEGRFAINYEAISYFKFILNMTIPFGVLFEMPVVMMFLTTIGILNPYAIVKIRKYVYFVLIIIGVMISPPDFMSDFITSVPLLVLFEISIVFSKFVYKRKQKREGDKRDENGDFILDE